MVRLRLSALPPVPEAVFVVPVAAAPDPMALLALPLAVAPSLYAKLPYDPFKDFAPVAKAAWIGLPNFVTPTVNLEAVTLIVPVVVMLVAENLGHVKAISAYMERDLTPEVGNTFIFDGIHWLWYALSLTPFLAMGMRANASVEERTRRDAAQKELTAQLQNILGEDGYRLYAYEKRWMNDPLNRIARDNDIPKDTAFKVFDLQKAAQAEAEYKQRISAQP